MLLTLEHQISYGAQWGIGLTNYNIVLQGCASNGSEVELKAWAGNKRQCAADPGLSHCAMKTWYLTLVEVKLLGATVSENRLRSGQNAKSQM